MAGEIKLQDLALLEVTESCEVCCVQGYSYRLLFVRDRMKIITEGNSSEKVDGMTEEEMLEVG